MAPSERIRRKDSVVLALFVLALALVAAQCVTAAREKGADDARVVELLSVAGNDGSRVLTTIPSHAQARRVEDGRVVDLGVTPCLLDPNDGPGHVEFTRPGFEGDLPLHAGGLPLPGSTPVALRETIPVVSTLLFRWPLMTLSLLLLAGVAARVVRLRRIQGDEREAVEEVSYIGEGGRVGRYRLESRLGEGAMAEVFRGRDPQSGREVAVKVLFEAVSADPEFRGRFERESAMTRAVRHPGLVEVFDSGEEGGRLYLVMELVRGSSLRHRIEEGPLPATEAVRIVADALDALAAAHEAGDVHRDLKPDNILLTDDGRVKVADFGLARGEQYPTLTQVDSTLGTPAYIPPEQVSGARSGAPADQYSMGCVLFELLAGRPPFVDDDPLMLVFHHVTDDPPSLVELCPDAPPALVAGVARLLEKGPHDRFPSARDAARALRAAT